MPRKRSARRILARRLFPGDSSPTVTRYRANKRRRDYRNPRRPRNGYGHSQYLLPVLNSRCSEKRRRQHPKTSPIRTTRKGMRFLNRCLRKLRQPGPYSYAAYIRLLSARWAPTICMCTPISGTLEIQRVTVRRRPYDCSWLPGHRRDRVETQAFYSGLSARPGSIRLARRAGMIVATRATAATISAAAARMIGSSARIA
jgi:hypothetical protein